jgi:hypothetical protein
MRVGSAVPAAGHGDGAELVGRGAVLRHVALRDHRVAGRRAEPAKQAAAVVTVGLLVGLAGAGGRVVGQRHHRDLALTGFDRHGGVADHADVGRTAVVVDAADAWLQAQRLGEFLRIHHLEPGRRRLDHQRIDLLLVDTRVGQRLAHRLDVQRHGAAARVLAEGGMTDAGDDDLAAQGMGHGQITSSVCNWRISSSDRPSQSP